MKLMRTEDAIGQVLCHDITQIIPGVKKGPVFQKGHIIAPEDVPVLLSVGKEHVYIWEKDDTRFHENEAARILCEMSRNDYMDASEPSEGKIELTAQVDGLFTLDRQRALRCEQPGRNDDRHPARRPREKGRQAGRNAGHPAGH